MPHKFLSDEWMDEAKKVREAKAPAPVEARKQRNKTIHYWRERTHPSL